MASHSKSKMSLVTLLLVLSLGLVMISHATCLDATRKIHSRNLLSEDADAQASTSGEASGSGSLSLNLGSAASSGAADTGGVESSYGEAGAGIDIEEADYANVESEAYSGSGVESETDFGFAQIDATSVAEGEGYASAATSVVVDIEYGETEDSAFGSTLAQGIAEGAAGGDGFVETEVEGETESYLDYGDFAYGAAGIEGDAQADSYGDGGNDAASQLNLGTLIQIEEVEGSITGAASVSGGGLAGAEGDFTDSLVEVEGGTVFYAAMDGADGAAISDGEGQAYGSVITSQYADGYGPSVVEGSTQQTSAAQAVVGNGIGVGYSSSEGTSFGEASGEYVSSYGAVSGETDANSDAFNGLAWTEGDSEGMFVSSAYGDGSDFSSTIVGGAASSEAESVVSGANANSAADGGASTGASAEGDFTSANSAINGFGVGNSGSSALESGGLAMGYGTADSDSSASGYGASSANANGGGAAGAQSGSNPDGSLNTGYGSGVAGGQADGEYSLTENTVTGYGATMSIATDVGSVPSGSSLGVTVTDAEIQTAGGSRVEGYGPIGSVSNTDANAQSLAQSSADAAAFENGNEADVTTSGSSNTEGSLYTEGIALEGGEAAVESGGVLMSNTNSETLFGAGAGAEDDKYGDGLGFGSTVGMATGVGFSDLAGGSISYGGAAVQIDGGSNADSGATTGSIALTGEDAGFGATEFDAGAGGSAGGNIDTIGAYTSTGFSAGGGGEVEGAANSLAASEDGQSIGGSAAVGDGFAEVNSATLGSSTSNSGAAGGEGEASGFSESGSIGDVAETVSASEGDGDAFVSAGTEGEDTIVEGYTASGGAVTGFGGAQNEGGVVAGEYDGETFIEVTTVAEGEDASIDKAIGSGAEGAIEAVVLGGDTDIVLGSEADSGGSVDATGDALGTDPSTTSGASSGTLGAGEYGDFLYIDSDGYLGGGDSNAEGIAYSLAFGDSLGEGDPRDHSLDSELEAGSVGLAAGLSSSVGIGEYGPEAAFGAALGYAMSFIDVEADLEENGFGGFVNAQADAFDSAVGFGVNGGYFISGAEADGIAEGGSTWSTDGISETLTAAGEAGALGVIGVATDAAGYRSGVEGTGVAMADGFSSNGFGPDGPFTVVDFNGGSGAMVSGR
jgi:hypothetical protein